VFYRRVNAAAQSVWWGRHAESGNADVSPDCEDIAVASVVAEIVESEHHARSTAFKDVRVKRKKK
jgi:hypothetical protein